MGDPALWDNAEKVSKLSRRFVEIPHTHRRGFVGGIYPLSQRKRKKRPREEKLISECERLILKERGRIRGYV